MDKKDKNKQKKKLRPTSSFGGAKKEPANNANDNLLVLDDYPPKPIPINSVKPTGDRRPQNEPKVIRKPTNTTPQKNKWVQQQDNQDKRTKKTQNTARRLWRDTRRGSAKVIAVIIGFIATVFAGAIAFLRGGRIGRTVVLAVIGIVAVAIIAGSLYLVLRNNAFGVTVDGEQVAIVSMASVRSGGDDVSDELVRQAKLRIEARVGSRILVNEQVGFEAMRVNRRYFLPIDEAIIRLDNALTFRVEAAAIIVDGVRMAIVSSYYEADRVLTTIKEPHLSFGIEFVETGFVETVSIDMIYVEQDYVQENSTALQVLTSTFESATEYSVVSGDSLELIAFRADMTLAELLMINPAVNPAVPLAIGTVLRLNVDQPILSVRTAEAISTTTAIDPPVEHTYNPTLRSPQRRIYRPGVHGEATVIEHVIRVNGMITERIEVERIVTREAVAEVIEVGTG